MVHDPQLLVLDEPTSQLDPVAGDELIWQLRRLNQESDTAVLLIEHRLELPDGQERRLRSSALGVRVHAMGRMQQLVVVMPDVVHA